MRLTKKIASVVTGTALVLYFSAVPAFAVSSNITGNGSGSENTSVTEQSSSTELVQSNDANIRNEISTTSISGSNNANDNTGGSVVIDTGAASSVANITNQANMNQAEIQSSFGNNDSINISGNGSNSANTATATNSNEISAFQDNLAEFYNNVNATARSGNNEALRNTGADTAIMTGNTNTTVGITNQANANSAEIEGCGNCSSSDSINIIGNGSGSSNGAALELENEIAIVQDNAAGISNNIQSLSRSGSNVANDNTNGDVLINTGAASSGVTLDNMANFNGVAVACDNCSNGTNSTISGNGSGSSSFAETAIEGMKELFQTNGLCLSNVQVENDLSATGNNSLERNTGNEDSLVGVMTNNATSQTTVRNRANFNVVGQNGMSIPQINWTFQLPNFGLL